MSGRKKRSPEEQARREKIRQLLQSSGVSSMEDIQNLFKETIYDYKNKDTDNSRDGHNSKTLRTSFGDVEVSVPRDRDGGLLWGPDPRVAENGLHIKGKMYGGHSRRP